MLGGDGCFLSSSRSLPDRITICPKWCSTGDLCKEMWHGSGMLNPVAKHKGRIHRSGKAFSDFTSIGHQTHSVCSSQSMQGYRTAGM